MRGSYDEWYKSMEGQWETLHPNNPQMKHTLKSITGVQMSKHLVGCTRPRNIKNWSRMTSLLLLHEVWKSEKTKESELLKGEVRLEISWLRLNKSGLAKLGQISVAAAAGDGMVLVKSVIPGDNPPEQLSEPYPLKKGYVKFKGRTGDNIERRYLTGDNVEVRLHLQPRGRLPFPAVPTLMNDTSYKRFARRNGPSSMRFSMTWIH